MHELSIALSMIESIEEEMARQDGGSVDVIHLGIGTLSGVDSEALRGAYQIACAGTSLEKARLDIAVVALTVYCPCCMATRQPEVHEIACPNCPLTPQEILAGRDLEITSLEIIV